jgi:hypothetical protein
VELLAPPPAHPAPSTATTRNVVIATMLQLRAARRAGIGSREMN